MKATRVKKFEKYWMIDSDLMLVHFIDDRKRCSNTDFANGNYFNTKEEAEAMADKIRKVLNGADVIEMPSDEDITEKIFNTTGDVVGREGEITVSHCMKTAKIVVEWLKSKIVG